MSVIQKVIEPVLLLKYPIDSNSFYEFGNSAALKAFLRDFDFSRLDVSGTGKIPSFQLGTKMEFKIDGYTHSAVRWGPRFVITHNANLVVSRGIMEITVPQIRPMRHPDFFVKTYARMKVPLKVTDAVLDSRNFGQLWPICYGGRTEMQKFFARIAREKYQIARM